MLQSLEEPLASDYSAPVIESRRQATIADTGHYGELCDILERKRLHIVFQPIVNLQTGEVFAYEALCRILGPTRFTSVDAMFKEARRHELAYDLEHLCRELTIARIQELAIDKRVAINICPNLLHAPDSNRGTTPDLMTEFSGLKDRIILELTERYFIKDYKRFAAGIDYYRKNGFMIAIDDLGAGFAGLRMLAQCQPAIVKIDRFLIANIKHSTKKRLLIEAIISFCRKINAQVVAEGIETEEELEFMIRMKADLAQGYYLGRPIESIGNCSDEAKACILKVSSQREAGLTGKIGSNSIGTLTSPVSAVNVGESVKHVIEMFNSDEDLMILPVIDNRKPVGIVQRSDLFQKLGQQFGYSLFSHRIVESIMKPVMVFESQAPLEEVTRKVLERSRHAIYDAVVVAYNGAYIGVVQIYELLQRISEQKIQLAIEANPLTNLPGNNRIKMEIEDRIGQNQIFAVFYFDLDNFKSFNDNFGFEKGDQVIRYLGRMIREEVMEFDSSDGFVGHVGGDDLVAICRGSDVETLCTAILQRFAREIHHFHDAETLCQGYYLSRDRRNRLRQYSILSLSIAVVTTDHRFFTSYGHLVSVASEVKKVAKSQHGNSFHIDRRHQ